jgi:hypothetical protein
MHPLWKTIVERGRAGMGAISGPWIGVKTAEVAKQRLKADATPRQRGSGSLPPVPQEEATERILYGHLMSLEQGTEIKYRVLTLDDDGYRYLPDLYDTPEAADAAGRSWCEKNQTGLPTALSHEVEPVWRRQTP